ncbi:nuclear transport factor 2 family protein [Mucilaginibacter sp.]|uniref:nuclear transport factor 2 family protein n=1 Tax=Mucilaginibacter sp. TaxID=1882438 RepID=UPI003D15219B
METKSNKTIVLECYRKIIRDMDLSVVNDYVHEDYIQHSPTIKDGRAGLVEMLTIMKSLPKPAEKSPSPIVRVIAEGDFVAIHLDVKFMGKQLAVVDLMRLKDGKLAEHWDAGQLYEITDSPITIINGSTVIEDSVNAERGKALVRKFYDKVLNGDRSSHHDYFTDVFIEHSQVNGLLNTQGYNIEIKRIMAEGNFVVAHCEYAGIDTVAACFDIFKLEDNKIAEHWNVWQLVPEVMAHGNGMF